jgi:ferredoxin--NADP+ reductase
MNWGEARVIDRRDEGPGSMVLTVAPTGWEIPPFLAGQFALLGVPRNPPRARLPLPRELVKRAYSVASPPERRDALEFYITLVPTGELTPRLFALGRGSSLWLGRSIVGRFTAEDVPADRNLVLLGTGTGIAPYVSMLGSSPFRVRAESPAGRIVVVHGVRHPEDLGYRAWFEALASRHPARFSYLPIVSRPESAALPWNGPVGHVQDLWRDGSVARALGGLPTPRTTHVFLCGNPAMVHGMTTLLTTEGFHPDDGTLHAERYW